MARIAITGLTKRLGNNPVLKGLNLDVDDKEFITLLGPSGCGKTTTLRILAGFLKPDGGAVAVDGVVLSSASGVVPPEKRRMGMVFQNYAVWPHMTVFENVAFGLKLEKVGRADLQTRVTEALRLVGLTGMGERYPAMLSGGQQQRVALARSLVVEPSILLLDEPLSNLDAKLRERMRVELKELQRRTGITFVYVTHDQAEAMALSDRVAVLNGGVLQQYDTPRAIYERPANLFVADFMGSVNALPGTMTGASGGVACVTVGEGVTLHGVPHALLRDSGGAVTVAIRPEAIRMTGETLGDAAGDGQNVLRGVVTDATYLGGTMEYFVDARGVRLRIHGDQARTFAAGEAVTLTLPTASCVIMNGQMGGGEASPSDSFPARM